MLAVVSPVYCDPAGYQVSNIDQPEITEPDDVIIKVHAASINPVDVKVAAGAFKLALPHTFPIKIGYDCAGVVTAIGSTVSNVKVGDKVYSRLPEASKCSWSETVKCPSEFVASMPRSLSFNDAASLPLAAMTAIQALRLYQGSLAGKTVFVPAGLGGTGAFACQLAKNVYKAGKVITTVSTAKVAKVPQYLGESVVDQIIDYTKEDPMKVIPRGSIDFVLDTMGQAMQLLHLMRPSTGTIVSISTTPSGSQLQNSSFFKRPDHPKLPLLARTFLDSVDYIRKLRARRWNVKYTYMFLSSTAADLDTLSGYVESGALIPVVGSVVDLNDIEKVREACLQVYNGTGGIGKTVFQVVGEP